MGIPCANPVDYPCTFLTEAVIQIQDPLLNTKWMLPNSTIVLSMCFVIRSNSFTVWGISFILQTLLHSSMIPFPLNSGVSLLNLHEYGMADVSTASIFIQSPVLSSCSYFNRNQVWSHDCLIHLHLSQLLSDLLYGYRR